MDDRYGSLIVCRFTTIGHGVDHDKPDIHVRYCRKLREIFGNVILNALIIVRG